jgi:hypothetical protein
MTNYLLRHAQVLLASLGQMARAPVATLLTLTVIGITLALPTGLYVMVTNIERLSAGWDQGAQISLFLKRGVSESGALKLAQKIRDMRKVTRVDYISRDAALAEFKQHSGFGSALNALGDNPLPAVLIVRPAPAETAAAIETLRADLAQLPGVDLAELDIAWLKRLAAILEIAERAVWILAALLATAVLLIIGNTIRGQSPDRDRSDSTRGRHIRLYPASIPVQRPAPWRCRWAGGLAGGGNQPAASLRARADAGRALWKPFQPLRARCRTRVCPGRVWWHSRLAGLTTGGRLAVAAPEFPLVPEFFA